MLFQSKKKVALLGREGGINRGKEKKFEVGTEKPYYKILTQF